MDDDFPFDVLASCGAELRHLVRCCVDHEAYFVDDMFEDGLSWGQDGDYGPEGGED